MSEYPDLSTMAMLGSMSEGFFKDLGIDTKKTFSEALDANPDLPATERVSKAMQATKEEFLTKAPVWMRINMLSHMIASAKEKGVPESDIDWDKINRYLTENTDPADFNNFDPIHSYQDFSEAGNASLMAQCDLTPWRREKCKDCGKVFYLYQLEIKSYLDKNLSIPKRCKMCRDKRKGKVVKPTVAPTPAPQKPVNNDPEPTAMEIAMRKAGLIK